jgi:hypothetical protein
LTTIKIPATVDAAVSTLGGLGELIIARKWERAAIVAAFVRLDLGNGRRGSRTSTRLVSPREFAEFGIIGLRSDASVRKYVQAWLDSHDDEYPEPDTKVALPTVEFPPMRTGTDGANSDKGLRSTIREMEQRHGPKKVAEAIADEAPTVAAHTAINAALDALIQDGYIHTRTECMRFALATRYAEVDR